MRPRRFSFCDVQTAPSMNRWLVLTLLVVAAGALALRLPQLDRRPMHNDEAVNAILIQGLWERGEYRYNPDEYHGPSLHYATLPFIWLSGEKDFDHLSERTLRRVAVAAGVALVLLMWLLRDALGRGATAVAAILLALSPAMVFYSRYFIHEMLLVCFTLLLLGGAWRYSQSKKLGWAALAGAGLGLMYATKETFVITLATLGLAVAATVAWNRWRDGARFEWRAAWNIWHFAVALGVAAAVALVFFTSFFTNLRGPFDSIATYFPWLRRAGGHSPHIHPWYYYFEHLFWYHPARSPVWTEAFIGVLALIGFGAALMGRFHDSANPHRDHEPVRIPLTCPSDTLSPTGGAGRDERARFVEDGLGASQVFFARFIAFFTVAITTAYSLISYKTPWCLLNFLLPMILLAGIGAVALVRLAKVRPLRWIIGLILALGCIHLGLESSLFSSELPAGPAFEHRDLSRKEVAAFGFLERWRAHYGFAAEWRNPYAYSQTVPNVIELADRVKAIARISPQGVQTEVKVVAPEHEFWPLPWYLRQLRTVWWLDKLPPDPYAPIMIVSRQFQAELDEKSNKRYLNVGLFELRPREFFELYVEFGLWKKFVETLPRPKDE